MHLGSASSPTVCCVFPQQQMNAVCPGSDDGTLCDNTLAAHAGHVCSEDGRTLGDGDQHCPGKRPEASQRNNSISTRTRLAKEIH